MKARIEAVATAFPESELSDEKLEQEHPEWNVRKLGRTTGIKNRNVAGDEVMSSDLAAQAALRLFEENGIDPKSIDYLLLCTQSPDFPLPTTACVVQNAVGMRTSVGAVDINLGCSGFVYSLAFAKGLIETGQASTVLVITVETFSKFANPDDKATRPIFGDGASAVLVSSDPSERDFLDGFVLGTDGEGGKHLVVPAGSLADGKRISAGSPASVRELESNGYDMYMDGTEIFNFTLRVVPDCVDQVLSKANLTLDEIDHVIFHQANGFLIEHLRKKLEIPREKFLISMADYGNTGSSTIPIVLHDALKDAKISRGDKVLVVGFGVGLSWGGAVLTW
ncbi:MAG: ketoacyl-ACP synthase III [Actinobacteria bacterium]|nr:ketoacyl-ACP synthase III [Actinomycetota bacterium]